MGGFQLVPDDSVEVLGKINQAGEFHWFTVEFEYDGETYGFHFRARHRADALAKLAAIRATSKLAGRLIEEAEDFVVLATK